jgi:hypothetical protein
MHRLQVRDDSASAHDGEVLAAVFHCVEKIREVPGGIRRSHMRHEIRFSDVPTGKRVPDMRLRLRVPRTIAACGHR